MSSWRLIEYAPWGKTVLLWKANTREHYVAARIVGDNPGWRTPDGYEIFGATHWQHLPDPPNPANGGTVQNIGD